MDQHVVPINDTRPHQEIRQCLCRPRLVEVPDEDRTIVVHHSYDAREWFEPDHEPEPVDG